MRHIKLFEDFLNKSNSQKIVYKGKIYWIEDDDTLKKYFAFEDPELTKVAKINGKTLMFNAKDIEYFLKDNNSSYKKFNESKIRANLIKILHEGIKLIPINFINESSKFPELQRLLNDAEMKGDELLIKEFVPEIDALVDKFFNSGQSGGSAPFTAGAIVDTIKKMMAMEPLGEGILGTDDEWNDISDIEDMPKGTGTFQNNRLSSVFKQGKDGRPYYLDAIVFKPVGKDYAFTSSGVGLTEGSKDKVGSMQYIKKFPFQPKTFYIDVNEKEYKKLKDGTLIEEEGGGWWESWLADPSQLDEVWKYYDKK